MGDFKVGIGTRWSKGVFDLILEEIEGGHNLDFFEFFNESLKFSTIDHWKLGKNLENRESLSLY